MNRCHKTKGMELTMSDLLNAINQSLKGGIPPQITVSKGTDGDQNDNENATVVADTTLNTRKPKLADKFNPANLRIAQNFGAVTPTEKKLTSVRVGKPNKQQWVRINPDPKYRVDVAVIEMKEEGSYFYLVEPSLAPELAHEVIFVTLFTAITREGNVLIWPVRLPDPEGSPNSWIESAREAASEALTNWVRVQANLRIGAYELWVAPSDLAKPKFPETSFTELLSIGFKGDRFIDTLDHPVVGHLRGTK